MKDAQSFLQDQLDCLNLQVKMIELRKKAMFLKEAETLFSSRKLKVPILRKVIRAPSSFTEWLREMLNEISLRQWLEMMDP